MSDQSVVRQSTWAMADDIARPLRSEATRLLCAGAYFDHDFRSKVIEQLVEHEERPVAPSLGVDVRPVLAHALRARATEALTGLGLLLLWIVFAVLWLTGVGSQRGPGLPVPWFLAYALVCLVCWGVRGSRGAVFALGRTDIKRATRGRLKAVLPFLPYAAGFVYWILVVAALASGADSWAAVLFPVLLVLPVWAHRARIAVVMRDELSRARFFGAPRESLPDTPRYDRIAAAIDREQYAKLAIYDPFRPFVGAGEPYKPWSIVMELRSAPARPTADPPPPAPETPGTSSVFRTVPDRGAAVSGLAASDPAASDPAVSGAAMPLTGREVIDLIKPRLEDLRRSAVSTSHDRLRSLQVDEMVYLPVGVPRADIPLAPADVQKQMKIAVGEGAEGRRHFLRIRIGAWDQQIVLSMLVRVHTQGGMLVLEVVPHVVMPVRPEYRSIDVLSASDVQSPLRGAVRAVLTSPAAGFAAAVALVRTAVSTVRAWLTMPEYAPPDAPAASVRELGSLSDVSLFQEMDVTRYVKTLQDRIASGVADALRAKGYETSQFEQHVVHVSEGGVYIGEMSGGAVATGKGASAQHAAEKGGSGPGKGTGRFGLGKDEAGGRAGKGGWR